MATKDLAIIILAAGKGTRMKSALPKVLHSVAGKPMLGHVLDTAARLKPKKIVTVLGPDMEEVEAAVGSAAEIVIQKEQLGTADAVKPALAALENFQGNVLILYADTPLIQTTTLAAMLDKLNEADVVVLGFTPVDAAEYGRLVVSPAGVLERIVEFKDASEAERAITLCNSGVMAGDCATLAGLVAKVDNKNAKGEYYLTDIIEIARGQAKKCAYVEGGEEEVIGVNNRVQLSEVEYILQQRLRYAAMMEGVTLVDPESVYFSCDTVLGKDVVIQPNVVFGSGVWIDDDVEIKAFSHLEGVRVSTGAAIGPFARIRPGTVIGEDARVGNFVEIKKSRISSGAKIGHLTYIGDAEVGRNANIGAGTVTCNYDGYNKYKTIIGDGAFIGSNSALVAPVTIGSHAFVGAGSTITKKIEDDALAVARNRQINKENWAKAYKKKQEKDKK